jgi:hypothetical protein
MTTDEIDRILREADQLRQELLRPYQRPAPTMVVEQKREREVWFDDAKVYSLSGREMNALHDAGRRLYKHNDSLAGLQWAILKKAAGK